jgi:hypothetical protein
MKRKIFTICIVLLAFYLPAQSHKTVLSANVDEIKVFLDCKTSLDMTYIKREISFVSYVIDRFDANVFILINAQATGSGGLEVTLVFNGQKEFAGLADTIRFYRYSTESNDDYRVNMVKMLKIGLTRYVGRSNLASSMVINVPVDSTKVVSKSIKKEVDNWDSWVLSFGFSGGLSGNDYVHNSRVAASGKASRVTEKMKMSFSNYAGYDKQIYYYDTDTLIHENTSYSSATTVVASVTDHLSVGGFASVDKSTYNNYKISFALNPSIEYSLFSYEQSSSKSVTLFYQVGPSFRSYIDSSFYGKTDETVYSQNLSLNAGVIKKWGSMWTSLAWNNFLNPFKVADNSVSGFTVHSFSLNGGIDLRVVKGLSFSMNGAANFNKGINPNIPLKSFTRDDLLTNARVLPTNQSFYVNVGISYRFGSIYSNVVNPRFGGAGS